MHLQFHPRFHFKFADSVQVAPPEVRGGLVALQQLAITAGIMIRYN